MAILINQRLLKVCMEKFNFPTGEKRQKIDGIIKGWQTAFKDHDLSKAKETSLQGKFFSKFFCEILGYTMQDDGTEIWTLKQEAKTEVDGKEADGSLGFYSKDKEKTHCVIELKDAQCNLDAKQVSRENKQTPVEQAFQYLYKFADCDWVIVSNFRYTRLYHKSKGQTAYEEFDILNLHEEKEFKRFYYCLCCENLLDKSSKSPMDLLIKQSGEADIDITKEFYSEFKQVRKILFEHICANNPNYDKKLLLEKTQKLLDRFIFIFFCEDTAGLLPHNTVENIYKMAQNSFSMSPCRIWEQFRGLFVSIDKGNNNVNPPINAYNGGLFAYDAILDSLIIKDEMFEHLKALARYDFESDLNVNILGHIFEQSLSDLEHIKNELDGITEDKKNSKRKKDGIFYTPEYITNYIVQETIGKYLEDNPDKLETIKILDPACGSGAFLNQAHEFLKQQHNIRVEERINAEKSSKRGGQEFVQVNLLKHINPMEIDRSILLNNLFGVDLNKESVEITKLALWLKTANSKCKLQNLDENIKCGNSLIDDETIAGDKAFKWENEFKNIMDDGGFDVIIGNPPYVSNKSMHRIGMQNHIEYWNKIFYSTNSGNYDIYILFIEKALSLLKEGGYVAFIIPNKFLISNYSKSILNYIYKHHTFIDVSDFSNCNVFEDASVYPIIIKIKKCISNPKNSIIDRKVMSNNATAIVDNINRWDYINITNSENKNKYSSIIKKISAINNKIDNLQFEPGINGFQFSNYSKCITEGKNSSNGKFLVTTGIIDPYKLCNKDVKYKGQIYKKPYINYDAEIISEGKWQLFNSPKILIAGMTKRIEAFIDIKGELAPAVSVYSILNSDTSILEYVLALLNSKLINVYFLNKFIDKHLAGGYISINNLLLQQIPLMIPSSEQKNIIVNKVRKIINYKAILEEETNKALELIEIEYSPKKISKNLEHFYELGLNPFIEELKKQEVKLSLSQKEDLMSCYKTKSELLNGLKTQIQALENEIDQEVYKLYGLTQDEIKIIEEG